MPSRRHPKKNDRGDRMKKSRMAFVSVGFLLINISQWTALRGVDNLIVSLISVFLGFIGFYLGFKAKRRIRRHHGVIQGEGAALIGCWGNLAIFVLSLLYFLWVLLIGIMSGELV